MSIDKLSAEQQQLLETDFGEEIEKMAEEKVAACSNCYEYGFVKKASEIADAFDKIAEEEEKEEKEEKEDKEEKMDDESEKVAAELGAFIERGVFDGLQKLGQERHDDPYHYILPLVLEKIAALNMEAVKNFIKAAPGKVKQHAVNVAQSAAEGGRAAKRAITNKSAYGDVLPEGSRWRNTQMAAKKMAPAAGYAAAAGLGGVGVAKAVGGKKED